MRINRYKLKHRAREGHRGAQLAERLLDRPDRLLGLILFGNNLVNFFAAFIWTVLALRVGGMMGAVAGTIPADAHCAGLCRSHAQDLGRGAAGETGADRKPHLLPAAEAAWAGRLGREPDRGVPGAPDRRAARQGRRAGPDPGRTSHPGDRVRRAAFPAGAGRCCWQCWNSKR